MGKFRDSVTEKLDSVGLANPFEVMNEALGGETREESKARRDREKEKEKAKEAQPAEPVQPVRKAKGGSVKSASARADGIAIRGKTRA
jgi:hypothetical protein